MELKQAHQVIAEALNIAIQKGCYGLIEVQNIVAAIQKIAEQPDVEFGEITPLENND